MTFLYVVSGNSNSKYSLMTRISAATLRISNPEAKIVLAIDKDSAQNLLKSQDCLLNEVDEVLEIETPSGSNGFKSRFIKTSLGFLMNTPFIFIDSDTVIRKKIDKKILGDFSIGAARNHSRDIVDEQIWIGDRDVFQQMNWQLPNEFYLNSGVIYFGGNEESKILSHFWHKYWLDSYTKTGVYRDQPALSKAIMDIKANVLLLDNSYNAQVKSRLFFSKNNDTDNLDWDAHIWHVYADHDHNPITQFEYVVNKVEKYGVINKSDIKKLIRFKHPWKRQTILDDFFAFKIKKLNRIKYPYLFWFEGKRIKAIKKILFK